MTANTRCCWLACLGLLVGAAGRTQEVKPDAQAPQGPRETAPLFLPIDFAIARQLDAARDYSHRAAWPEALRILQRLLEASEDLVVPVRDPQTKTVAWVGVCIEAERQLDQLPEAGREAYELLNGSRASALLAEARRTGDAQLLEEAARRYRHTAAGATATRLLGLHHLDRGHARFAALCFARLLDRANEPELPPATRFAAVLAFRLAGDEKRAQHTWKQLIAQAPRGVDFGTRVVPLADLEGELTRTLTALRARIDHADRGDAVPARLEHQWTQPTVDEPVTGEWLQTAVMREEDRSLPILPGSIPIRVGNLVCYRTARGIQGVDLLTGRHLWEAASEWGLDRMARAPRYHPHVASWIMGYWPNNPNILFENTVLGTLSTDGARVYAVEDLPIPPFPAQFTGSRGRGDRIPPPPYPVDLSDPVHHSRLLALEAATGRLAWEVGSRGAGGGALSDSHFLGPPLPLDGRVYAVLEKNLQVRLVCLDAARGQLLWTQTLAIPFERLLRDVGRRVQANYLAYADGVLVCATNVGALLGIDVFRRGIAWAYPYREEVMVEENEPGFRGGRSRSRSLPRLRADWRAAAPRLHAGRLLFTAPDTGALHCLDLRTGTLRWKAERADGDLYLACVHGGHVMLVGSHQCRALRLADGEPAWTLATGQPAGRGMASGKVYYLPVKAAAPEKVPAVLAIDLEKGTLLGHTVAPDGETPGNLIDAGSLILSQTVTGVTAYSRSSGEVEEK